MFRAPQIPHAWGPHRRPGTAGKGLPRAPQPLMSPPRLRAKLTRRGVTPTELILDLHADGPLIRGFIGPLHEGDRVPPRGNDAGHPGGGRHEASTKGGDHTRARRAYAGAAIPLILAPR